MPMESSSIRRDRITRRLESGWFGVAANSTTRMRSRPRLNRPIDRTTSVSGSWQLVAVVEEDPSGNQAAEPENQEVLPRNP